MVWYFGFICMFLQSIFFYVLRREKRLVGKNPLRCMRFIEAKFQLNKYATFSNQGSASAQLQSKFSTIDFLSTLLAKFLPAALHFLHFAKNEKRRKEENNIEHVNANCSAKYVKRSPRFNAPQTWHLTGSERRRSGSGASRGGSLQRENSPIYNSSGSNGGIFPFNLHNHSWVSRRERLSANGNRLKPSTTQL